jgi:serine/threonine-protein kinase
MAHDRDWLQPGGGLRGPLWRSLARRMDGDGPGAVQAGERIGPYRVVAELGRGGMARVYRAERADGAYRQEVALKLVDPRLSRATGQEMLRRERQILASLQHPGIARLLDGGATDDGRLWLAMELVEGRRIDQHCRERGLDLAARLRLFTSVCAAVRFAHERGLVHCDIKAGNILVSEGGEAKLLDFGIAAAFERSELGEAPRALTPGSASPEQLRGDPATTASDVWQLGRLLDGLVGPGAGRSRDLAAIVGRATAAEPAQRYASVAELASDVGNHLVRRPVAARRGGALYRLSRLIDRNRWTSAVALAAIVALLAMASAFALRLTIERNQALSAARRANAATQFMVEVFNVADPARNRGDRLSANEILARGRERLDRDFEAEPALRAYLLEKIGVVHMGLGQLDQAETLLRQATALSRDTPGIAPTELAWRMRRLAQVVWRLDRYAEAQAIVDEAYELVAGLESQGELQATLLQTRAACEILLGRPEQAERTQRRVLSLLERYPAGGAAGRGRARATLAEALAEMNRHAEAAELLRVAVGEIASALESDHPDALVVEVNLARQLAFDGRAETGWPVWERAAARLHKVVGENDFRARYAQLIAAEIEHRRGHDDRALARVQRALGGDHEQPGTRVRIGARARLLEGEIALRQGRTGDAERALHAALELAGTALPEDHPDRARIHRLLGAAQCAGGERADGRRRLAAALAVQSARPYLEAEASATQAALAACGP